MGLSVSDMWDDLKGVRGAWSVEITNIAIVARCTIWLFFCCKTLLPIRIVFVACLKASGRLKTSSVMQTLSGFSDRLSHRESDFNPPPGESSEARGGYDSFCRSPTGRENILSPQIR